MYIDNIILDGNGSLHGVDYSEKMFDKARKKLGLDINGKQADKCDKINIHLCSVTNMPFEDEKFDRVFHVNCFYYWADMDAALTELYRVMKPGALMVTTLNNEKLQRGEILGWLRYGDIDNSRYMNCLERNGFENVLKKRLHTTDNVPLDAILATKRLE